MRDEIIAILDRSYSMAGYEDNTIKGFNAFIDEQRELSDDCAVTLILFDDRYEKVYEALPIEEVPKLTRKKYFVRGSTALNDAVARASNEAGLRFNNARRKPKNVIVYITTDGAENASKEYTARQLKKIITTQENEWGWEYIYSGCDHDVERVCLDIGIKTCNTVNFSKSRMVDNYAATSGMVSSYRK